MKKTLLLLLAVSSLIFSQTGKVGNADQYMFLKKNVADSSKTQYNPANINPDQYIFSKKILLNSTGEKFDASGSNADQYYFLNKKLLYDASLKTAQSTDATNNFAKLEAALATKSVLKGQSIPSKVSSVQTTAILKYDNGNISTQFLGIQSGTATVEASERFTPSVVSPYVGWQIKSVDIYIGDVPTSCALKIYDAGTSTTPGTLLATQTFTPTAVAWNRVTLTTPVTIANRDIWVGYTISLSGAMHSIGMDTGPATADGDWLLNGTWMHSGYPYTWLIRANIESPSAALILTYNQIDASSLPTIKSYVSVTDNTGNPISGLTSSNFTVTENSAVRTPITVTTAGGTGSTISVALVIDKSGSMAGQPLTDAQTAANSFVNNMQTNDKGAVISFDDIITVNLGFTTDKTALKNAINSIVSGNNTAIYDALYQAVDLTKLQTGRKAVILMTDGADNSSTHSMTDAISYAILNSIPVYTIGLGITAGSSSETSLQQIASQTGGKYYLAPSSSQLLSIYQSLSQQLNNQYLVTYTSPIQCGTTAVNVNITATYNGATDNKTKQYTPPACNNLILTYNQIDASNCPAVRSYVTVTDLNGIPITGLTSSNFTVKEDNVTQSVTVTTPGSTGGAISVAIVIDKSGSMAGQPLTDAKTAATSFVNNMQTNDQGALISFDDIVTTSLGFTTDKTALRTAINNIVSGNNTAIYDAMYRAVDITKVQTGRKAVILMTDGADNSSTHSMTDAINYAIQNSVPIYTIGLGITAGSSSETSLQQIASQTGGKYYLAPSSSQLLSIYQSLSQQLNNQYLITYTSTSTSATARTVSITATYNSATATQTKTYTSTCSNLILTYNQIDNSGCPVVKSYVTVTNSSGTSITGLTSSNFTVNEDNVSQSIIVTSAGGTGSAISVALVIDKSGSMSGTPLSDALTAANSFVNNMQANDKGAVISFDDFVTINQAFTTDKTALRNAINGIIVGNNTAIYDAIYQAVDLTKVQTGRKAIILMTDGADNSSSHSMTVAINYAIQNSIPVYTIGLGLTAGSSDETNLQQIASQTGGKYYLAPNSSQLLSIYQSISQQLNNQYLITYTSSSKVTIPRAVSIIVTYSGSTDIKTKTYTSTCSGGNATEDYVVPSEFSLSQNYPNPFNPSTKISYTLPRTTHVKLILYDVLGVELAVLVDSEKPFGSYEVEVNGSNLASGVYFIRMNAGSYSVTKKIMLMK